MISFKTPFLIAVLQLLSNLGFATGAASTNSESDSVVTVRFYLKKDSRSAFYHIDQFGNFKQVLFDRVAKDTILQKRFSSLVPLQLYSNFGKTIPFMLAPGDTVNLMVENGSVQATSHLKTQPDINFFNDLAKSNLSIFDYQHLSLSIQSGEQRTLLLDSLYKGSIAFLESEKTALSQDFYLIYRSVIDYEYLKHKLTRVFVDKSPKLPTLTDSIASLVNQEKKYYLNELVRMLEVFNVVKWGNDFKHPDYFARQYDSSSTFYSGEIKNRMLLTQLTGIRNKTPKHLKNYVAKFLLDCENNQYKEYVQANFITQSVGTAKELISMGKDAKSWPELLQLHKGKVIFIDFWASWCVPCRREMPAARKLISSFDSKDFVYVFISIDNIAQNWKEACGEEGILAFPESYLIAQAGESKIGKSLQLSTIPRYILINKSGEIVDRNAPGPGEITTIGAIRKLISN